MMLIVGLGNPGKKYEKTWHNVGSLTVDELRSSPRFANAHAVGELKSLDLQDDILAKPNTFMNESGKALKKLINHYQLSIKNLIVAHDDIDLSLGTVRVAKN